MVGEDAANTIMELLPSQPHNELMTRQDAAATTAMLRGEMAELRADVSAQIAALQKWAAGILATNVWRWQPHCSPDRREELRRWRLACHGDSQCALPRSPFSRAFPFVWTLRLPCLANTVTMLPLDTR